MPKKKMSNTEIAAMKGVSFVHTSPIVHAFEQAQRDIEKAAKNAADPEQVKLLEAQLKKALAMMPGCPQSMAFYFANKIDKSKDR